MSDYAVRPPTLAELQLRAFADETTLKTPRLSLLREDFKDQYLPLSWALNDHFRACEERLELLLPNLAAHGNESVGIFSDYAGESSGRYRSYSFLVCALQSLSAFADQMKGVRERTGLGDKEIAFKDLRMGSMLAALPDYLRALDHLVVGLLFTVVVDKRLVSIFGAAEKATCRELARILEEGGFGSRKANTAEKTARIAHCAAYLTAMLAHPGQKLFWMTDNDEIAPDQERLLQTLTLFQQVLPLYQAPELGGVLGGALPFQERHLGLLDLLSAADLAASSVEHFMSRRAIAKGGGGKLKPGADRVVQWLGHDSVGLKKSTVLLEPGADGAVRCSALRFWPGSMPEGAKMVPLLRGRSLPTG